MVCIWIQHSAYYVLNPLAQCSPTEDASGKKKKKKGREGSKCQCLQDVAFGTDNIEGP